MKIILEPTEHKTQHRVIIQHQSDELDIKEVAVLIRGALVAYGFHSDNVNEILPEE